MLKSLRILRLSQCSAPAPPPSLRRRRRRRASRWLQPKAMALKLAPGKIISSEYEKEGGGWRYSFDIQQPAMSRRSASTARLEGSSRTSPKARSTTTKMRTAGVRILIAEDDNDTAEFIQRGLEQLGHNSCRRGERCRRPALAFNRAIRCRGHRPNVAWYGRPVVVRRARDRGHRIAGSPADRAWPHRGPG